MGTGEPVESRPARPLWKLRLHLVLTLILALAGSGLAVVPFPPSATAASLSVSPPPMPVISRGVPAYASGGYPAANANDSDYSTTWNAGASPSTTSPSWLAYDLSGVPAASRANVVYAWYNDDTGDYIQSGAYYGMPRDYTIDANAAPGGSVPATGWTTLVTVTGNSYPDREHVLNLSGYNWVRIRITATRGGAADIQADVHDVNQGDQDDWLFLGDSITMEGFLHHNIDGSAWEGGDFAQLVNASVAGHFPLTIDGGVGGTTISWAYTNRAALLQNFTGQFVAISFGTNDANVSGALDATTVSTWYSNLLGMVDYVTGLGKTPVVGKIPWGSANGGWLATNAQTLNSKIDQLYRDRPGVVPGPDLYTFFANHHNLIGDGIHPTYDHGNTAGTYQGYVGYEWLLRQWRDAMVANVYSAAPVAGPAVTLSPTSVSFGSQRVGTTSATQTVTLTNSGNASLTIASIGLTGTNAGDFAQTSTCPTGSSLSAGSSCTISVSFSPSASGSRSASLAVTDNASGSPQTVALAGTGTAPAVTLSPASLAFGNQPSGTTSAAQTVTLTNSGNAALTIASIQLTGTNAADFSQTTSCPIGPSPLAPGASCTISVRFTPALAAAETASLSVTDDAADTPQAVSLSGTGTSPSPVVSLSPTGVSFGNQAVGTSSNAQTVTLTNTGNADLSLTSIEITGTNGSDFAQSNTCPATLPAGASCPISVTFAPTTTGSRSASLSLSDNGSGSPQMVALSGTGTAPAVSLSPTSLTFGSQQTGTTSAAQTLTLTNSGTAPLSLTSLSIGGSNAADFGQTSTCPIGSSALAAGATCSVSVTFTPSLTGSESASLTIADNASGSPQSVSLTATGSTTSSQLFSDGFESGSLPGAWTKTTVSGGNSLTLDGSNVHSGSASLKAEMVRGTGTNAKISKSISGQTSIDVRAYYDLSSPVNWGNVPIMTLYAQGYFIGWLAYYVDPDSPTLSVYNGANNVSYDCSLPSLNSWHSVEIRYVLSTTTSGSFTVWVDGVQACAASNIRTSPAGGVTIDQVVVGVDDADTTVGLTVNVDDVVIGKSYVGP